MKNFTFFLLIIVLLSGTYLIINNNQTNTENNYNNVKVIDNKQIIEIEAKGGYSPAVTTAKADLPTIIRMKTKGTFDCSSALVIPSLNYQKNLPLSGDTDIIVPAQKAGTTLKGLCSMGMFSFQINFS